jgi:hypothetical protein
VNGCDITVAPARFATSTVSSVESFSTTITSRAHPTLATHASMFAASLCAAIITDTGTDPPPTALALTSYR